MRSKKQEKQANVKEVLASRIYFFVINELFIKAVLIQIILVFCYLTLWFKTDINVNEQIRKVFSDVVVKTQQTALRVQELNAIDATNECFDYLEHQKLLFSMALEFSQSDVLSASNFKYITDLDGEPLDQLGYYVEGQSKKAFADLTSEVQTAILASGGLLSSVTTGIDNVIEADKILAYALIKQITLSGTGNPTSLLTVFKYTTLSRASPTDIFSKTVNCINAGTCQNSCLDSGSNFLFECLTENEGLQISPLNLISPSLTQTDTAIYYSSKLQDGLTLLIFSTKITEDVKSLITIPGSKAAIFTESRSTQYGISTPQLHFTGIAKAKSKSVLRMGLDESDVKSSIDYAFAVGRDKRVTFKDAREEDTIYSRKVNMWGFEMQSMVQEPLEAYEYSEDQVRTQIVSQLSMEIAIMMVIFALNLYMIHTFIYTLISSVLNDLQDLDAITSKEDIFLCKFDHITYREIRDLVEVIVEYKTLVQFIATIKGRDALNSEKLRKFEVPLGNSENHLAQIYIFNFFMKELEVELEKQQDSATQATKLQKSIKYGFNLYSTYKKMINNLVENGEYSEFELRRMNMSIFRLFEVLLGLMMKLVKMKDVKYTDDDALMLYEQTYKFVDSLNMNDTVRLGLILKKIVILLNKGQYTVALDHLKEVESMLNLLLKNKRVLLYMEEEYKLLTFYYQLYLDLLSEYYYLIKSYGESTKCILEMFRYGGIYNISSRIKAFNRLISIIEDNSRHIPAFPAQSLRTGFQRRTVEHARIANLNRYITFTLNERRNFIFMIDCSEDSIDHIDCIQSTFKNVLDLSAKPGDCFSTFCFDDKLYQKDVGNSREDIPDVYNFMGDYFDFIRSRVTMNTREYYENLSTCLSENESEIRSQPNPEGRPMYLIMCIFGRHNPSKYSAFSPADGVENSARLKKLYNMESNSDSQNNVYMRLQSSIDRNMVNMMIITSCLETFKKEKLPQSVAFAKRSLIVDLAVDKPNLSKLLSEFIN